MQIIRRLPCTRSRIARCLSFMQSSLALTFTLDWASNYLLIVLVSSTVHLLEVAEAAQLLLQEQHMNLLNRPKSIHIAKKTLHYDDQPDEAVLSGPSRRAVKIVKA